MQLKKYTHKGIDFWKGEGLCVYLKEYDIFPAKLQINNGSLGWRLNRRTWLSVKQFKRIRDQHISKK